MPTCDDILLLARYNATMNRQMYDAAATLPHEAVVADRGGLFRIIAGNAEPSGCS